MEQLIKEPQSYFTVRFNHCDPFGHLNNSSYIDYFINAREDHLAEHYNIRFPDYLKQGLGWVVGSHEIAYLRPASSYETVCIQTCLIDFSDSHVVVEGLMFDEAQRHLKALLWTKYVFVNINTGKKEKHSEEFLALLSSLKNEKIDYSAGVKTRIVQFLRK